MDEYIRDNPITAIIAAAMLFITIFLISIISTSGDKTLEVRGCITQLLSDESISEDLETIHKVCNSIYAKEN